MALSDAEDFRAKLPSGKRRHAKIFRWFTALDNYSPTRDYANGHAVSHPLPFDDGAIGVTLVGIDKLMIPAESVYVLVWPDGTTVAMYPVAWHGPEARITLHSYSSADKALSFGPKRSYLIRLSEMK